MHVLVTAGNTLVLIDRVRCLTNVFTGRTGASIAIAAHSRGHRVTLLTSHAESVDVPHEDLDRWSMMRYRTFDDLRATMAERLVTKGPDVLVHTAAVSDYLSAGVYSPDSRSHFDDQSGRWHGEDAAGPAMVDRAAGKVKSDEPELWLRLVRAPKLIDMVRTDWQFAGTVVKFKLEVGVDDQQLLDIAERSRRHSKADLMVANTLEGSAHYAFLGPIDGSYRRVSRRELPNTLLAALESLHGA
jgi:phosphopantothenoylcysteine synthetase/decarboxylase